MTDADFAARLDTAWSTWRAEGEHLKDPMLVVDRLSRWYETLDVEDRQRADRVISDWLLTDSPSKRYCAMALIREYKIRRAERSLQILRARLVHDVQPWARDEREDATALLTAISAP